MKKLDIVTLAILVNRLHWITEEMNQYLVRTAFSTNIKMRKDCSCAIYTCNGEMLAQGTFVPVHLGIMSQTLKEILKDHPIDSLSDGDAIIHNDPYRMGSHLWDVMVFKPIFIEKRLVAFVGNLAHHVDVGGSSVSAGGAVTTIYEEGLRLPAVKIMRDGVVQEDILKVFYTNSRTSYESRGDLMAQIAANHRGEQRIREIATKYGVDMMIDYFNSILDYSEKGMRDAIGAVPDGEAVFEDFLETDGITDKLVKICAKVMIKGTDIYLNFAGSGGSGAGPVNSPWSLTHSAAYYAVKSVIGSEVPANSGAYRAIHLIRPQEDSIVDARFPHAVSTCTMTPASRIVDVIIGALCMLFPEKACACDGNYSSAYIIQMNPRTGRFSAFAEAYCTGRGAKHNADGADAHQSHMTNTANAPVEVIEVEHPLRVDKYALLQDTGGPGEYRGGLGITRELTCLCPATVAAKAMRPATKPYGVFGGVGGSSDYCAIVCPNGNVIPGVARSVETGSKVVIRTSGGGGWGNPYKRATNSVKWDVLNEYITAESAKENYGCIINPQTFEIDATNTDRLRAIKLANIARNASTKRW